MTMRAEVRAVLEALLARTEAGAEITLDALGDAIGAMSITQDEIDVLMRALEEKGRTVGSERGGHGEETLKRVLDLAREMKASGKTPTVTAIAEGTGLSIGRVRNALALARVIARS
jgi:hypothetical protein